LAEIMKATDWQPAVTMDKESNWLARAE